MKDICLHKNSNSSKNNPPTLAHVTNARDNIFSSWSRLYHLKTLKSMHSVISVIAAYCRRAYIRIGAAISAGLTCGLQSTNTKNNSSKKLD